MPLTLSFPKAFERDVLARWRTKSPQLIVNADVQLTKRGWSYLCVGEEFAPFIWTKTANLHDPWSLVFEYEIAPSGTKGPVDVSARLSVCCEGVAQILEHLDESQRWPRTSRSPSDGRYPARLFFVSPEWLAINNSHEPLGSLFSPADEPESTLSRLMTNLDTEVEPLIRKITNLAQLADFLLQVRSFPNNCGGSGYRLNDVELYAAVLLHHLGMRNEAHAAALAYHQVAKSRLNQLGADTSDFLYLEKIVDRYTAYFQSE